MRENKKINGSFKDVWVAAELKYLLPVKLCDSDTTDHVSPGREGITGSCLAIKSAAIVSR